jgi:hypothetical protein
MSDGGSHFNCTEVREFCDKWGTKTHVVAAYSPWVNGLVEGTNKLLLYVLARLCAPELGEDHWGATTWDKLPRTWPDHFDEAIRILNRRILPAVKFSPKELLLGLVVNTPRTPLTASTSILSPDDTATQMAYVAQQHLDGYAECVQHAIKRKAAFDKRVFDSKAGQVIFKKGQLIQIYRSDLTHTFKAERKLLPKWSQPHRITSRLQNSYWLETIEGNALNGEFHARRLRPFIPREGTALAEEQKAIKEKVAKEQEEVEKDEAAEVDRMRAEEAAGKPEKEESDSRTSTEGNEMEGEAEEEDDEMDKGEKSEDEEE